MKTNLSVLFAIICFFAVNAQEDIIRNGDFESNDGAGTITGLDYWHIDKESPKTGLGGSEGSRYVYLASDDSTGFYQVIDTVKTDSMIYELSFYGYNSWQGDSLMVTFSTSDDDSSVRTSYFVDTVIVSDGTYGVTMSIPSSSSIVGKKLMVELQVVGITDGWTNISDVALIRKKAGQNSPPVASAGTDQTVVGNTEVTLDGSGSTDSDGDSLTYIWNSQYPGITLSDAAAQQPTFTAPDVTEISNYTFSLVVNDGTTDSETAYIKVTVTPAGELIRNGDFAERENTWETSNSLKDIKYWNMDSDAIDIAGGIWDLTMIHITNVDQTLYQVVDEIDADTSIYTLTFSAKTSWYGKGITSIFSVSNADTSERTQIETQDNEFDIDPDGGTTASDDFEVYKHVFVIPANSSYVGKKLTLEFQATLYDNFDDVDTSWSQIELVSLVKETIEGGSVAVANTTNEQRFILYPNPTDKTVYIETEAQILSGQIYSMDGKIVKVINEEGINQINVSDLLPGIYIVRFNTNKGLQQIKLQVQ